MSAIRPIGNSFLYAPEAWAAPGVAGAWVGERLAARGILPRDPDVSLYAYQISHLSEALTQTNALWQHNVLGQTGVRSEHVGGLVVFAQYAAKAASMPAVMEAVWLSPDYASLVEAKRQLMFGPAATGSQDIVNAPGFWQAAAPAHPAAGAGGNVGQRLNLLA